MAFDKAVDSAQLNADLTSVANAIRTKGKTSAQLAFPAGFISAVQAVQTGIAPKLVVQTSAGASVTITKGSTTISGTAGADGTFTREIPEAGEWKVTVSGDGLSDSKTILIGTQSVSLPLISSVFAENTWGIIAKACQSGTVPSTWAVGDSKTMTIGDAEYQIDIIGKKHDDYADGSGKAPLTFMLHDCYAERYAMSDNNSTNGGWPQSQMRTQRLPAILALMPADVQAAIRAVNKVSYVANPTYGNVTTADKLFLLSENELFGTQKDGYANEGTQYERYQEQSNRIKKDPATSKATFWFERTLLTRESGYYCTINNYGSNYNYGAAQDELGASFAFCF